MEGPLICCVLCGAPIERAYTYPPWLDRYRAIYVNHRHASERVPCLSGRGWRSQYGDIVRVNRDDLDDTITGSQAGCAAIELMIPGWENPRGRMRGFPFHSACWSLLEQACAPGEPAIQSLWRFCRSCPVRNGIMHWGHNYGGAAVCLRQPAPGEEAEFRCRVDEWTFRCDPMDIPQIREALNQVGSGARDLATTGEASKPLLARTHTGPKEVFYLLPTEILQAIVVYLSSPAVGALRSASRAYAALPLHDAFWRSRFTEGHEFDFVFEIDQDAPQYKGRWKAIFDSIHALRLLDGMVNRRRIWYLACSLRDLLAKVGGVRCNGDQHPYAFEPNEFAATSGAFWSDSYLEDNRPGTTVIHERKLTVSNQAVALFVSTINIFGRRYVSGIRILQRDGCSLGLGYTHPRTEVQLVGDDQEEPLRITGFYVAQDQRGIRGLSVMTGAGTLSSWAGDHLGVARRRLVRSSTELALLEGLKGEFDALRLLKLSVSAGYNLGFRDTTAFLPDIPEPDVELVGLQPNDDADEEGPPTSLVMLGGPQGQDLPYLCNFAVITAERGPVLAFEASFANGRPPVRFGLFEPGETVDRIDFDVDGPGGERIITVEGIWANGDDFAGFRVVTNWGRTFDSHEGCPPKALRPDNFEVKVLRADGDSSVVVGFWMTMTSRDGFTNIGPICVKA